MTRLLAPLSLLLAGCLSTPPPHPRALEANELCTQYLSAGDLTRAEVQCDLGLQFSPQYADLWVNKGLIALTRGQRDNAKDDFIKALRYNQEQAAAYNNLGFIYYQDRSFGKAHDNFQRALKVNPDYTEARYNLALCFMATKENAKAKKELRTIIAINPNLADPHASLGSVLHEESAFEEAVQELTLAVQLDPKFATAWLELGNTQMDAGNAAEAHDAYTNCIEADPDNIECKNNVALASRKAALQDSAVKEVKENAAGTNTPEGWFRLAQTDIEKGLVPEAERNYKKCLHLDAKFAVCHFGLFQVFKTSGRDKDALTACKNFLKFADQSDYKAQADECERFVSSKTY